MKEVWKPVDGVPMYEVSNLGRVRSLHSTPSRIRKPQVASNGYLCVDLQGRRHMVHRLVAKAFVPGDHAQTVNHIDGIRAHNRATNLQWTSMGDNHRHAYRALNRQPVVQNEKPVWIDGQRFASRSAAARHLGCHVVSLMTAIRKGRNVFKGRTLSWENTPN